MKQYYNDSPFIRQRDPGVPNTSVTNELARAVNRMAIGRHGQVDSPVQPRQIFWVQLQSRETGGGKYSARSVGPDLHSGASPSTDLTGSDFGTLAAGDDCQVWNYAELNANLHALAVGASSPFLPVEFTGYQTIETHPRKVCRLLDLGINTVMVKITATAAGGGKYVGSILLTPTADISASGDLTAAEIGAVGTTCRVLNASEIGVTGTWDIDPAGNQNIFFGRITKYNTDGTPIVVINGFNWGDCS